MADRPIQVLSDEVIGQIAAGEVVERPAAAVKELVENSIDAGATAVTVELRDGGVTSIRVGDNGRGIPAQQVRMAFARHATSKLRSAEELYDVRTLGFRGEALASIAAVSKVTCVTRVASAEYGVKAQVEAGEFISVQEAAGPVGTTVTVRDLFYNAPVRLKFLKKPAAEAAYVSDYVMRLILSHPEVAFRFVNQGKTVYRSAGDGTLESALYCVYGREALREMRRVSGAANGLTAEGYVGVGDLSRGNRMQQSFFINGRYFRNEGLSRALESGCEGFVMIGRYPICALSLTLPYRQVDVNVHPNKLEVRFQRPDEVAEAVRALVRGSLTADTMQSRLAGGAPGTEVPEKDEIRLVPLSEDANTPGDTGEAPDAATPAEAPVIAPTAPIPAMREATGYARGDEETLVAARDTAWLTESASYGMETDGESDGQEPLNADADEPLPPLRPEKVVFAPEMPWCWKIGGDGNALFPAAGAGFGRCARQAAAWGRRYGHAPAHLRRRGVQDLSHFRGGRPAAAGRPARGARARAVRPLHGPL
jgi:DNA mismatch repair protein MutL